MSRAGRDYLQTGFYTEVFFRQHGVHFAAIANSVDSDDQNSNEFAPFLNIMNEWYLRDLSRKQKTAIRVKANTFSQSEESGFVQPFCDSPLEHPLGSIKRINILFTENLLENPVSKLFYFFQSWVYTPIKPPGLVWFCCICSMRPNTRVWEPLSQKPVR